MLLSQQALIPYYNTTIVVCKYRIIKQTGTLYLDIASCITGVHDEMNVTYEVT